MRYALFSLHPIYIWEETKPRKATGINARIAGKGDVRVAEVDIYPFIAWKNGRMVFENERLEKIMAELQRWYDFEVFFQQQEVKNYRFRGVLSRDMDIRQALDIIEETTDLKFDIKGKTILVRK